HPRSGRRPAAAGSARAAGQRADTGEAGEQTLACHVFLVALVGPPPDEGARPQRAGLQPIVELEPVAARERGAEGMRGDLPLALLDPRRQLDLALPREQRRTRDLPQVESLGIRLPRATGCTAVAPRLEIGCSTERGMRRDGAARPEDVVTQIHERPPVEA